MMIQGFAPHLSRTIFRGLEEALVPTSANIAVYSGLLIGLAYGAVGLLSGFCLLSGLRGWWANGDSRLIRTYALALGVAIAAAQLLAASGVVDLGKSIYLQPSFSAPLMLLGGVLFGYGMVLSNGFGAPRPGFARSRQPRPA